MLLFLHNSWDTTKILTAYIWGEIDKTPGIAKYWLQVALIHICEILIAISLQDSSYGCDIT